MVEIFLQLRFGPAVVYRPDTLIVSHALCFVTNLKAIHIIFVEAGLNGVDRIACSLLDALGSGVRGVGDVLNVFTLIHFLKLLVLLHKQIL